MSSTVAPVCDDSDNLTLLTSAVHNLSTTAYLFSQICTADLAAVWQESSMTFNCSISCKYTLIKA